MTIEMIQCWWRQFGLVAKHRARCEKIMAHFLESYYITQFTEQLFIDNWHYISRSE